jgi:hypothetical protein
MTASVETFVPPRIARDTAEILELGTLYFLSSGEPYLTGSADAPPWKSPARQTTSVPFRSANTNQVADTLTSTKRRCIMQAAWRITRLAFVAMVLSAVGSSAYGQQVTFSQISDAVPAKFFNAATTAPDVQNPNRLIIRMHTGMDWTIWKATDFRASTAAYSYTSAMDTIRFRVKAPAGYYIAKITYTQRGAGTAERTGKVSGGAHWVVGDFAFNLGGFSTTPSLSRTVDLTGRNLTSLPVSITASLFAFATPQLGSANLALTGAEVHVQLLPLTGSD